MNIHGEPRKESIPGVAAAGAPREAAPQLSVSAALIEVNGIMAMVMSMGNNDYEVGALNAIIRKLQANNYDNPASAVNEARAIMDNKLIR